MNRQPPPWAEYNAAQGTPLGSDAYYSVRFAPADKRDPLTALHAFAREVRAIPAECADPGVARAKLAWWRGEIARSRRDSPQHPVSSALAPARRQHALPDELFQEVLDGVEMELDTPRCPDFRHLQLRCQRVGGSLSLLTAEILGYQDRRTRRYAADLGVALDLTRLLRDVGGDLRQGRLYLPLDELAEFGLAEERLLGAATTEPARRLLSHHLDRAVHRLQQALEHLPARDRYRQLPGLVQARLALALLEEIRRDGYRVLERRISLTPVRKLWVAWRTERGERRRARRPAHGEGAPRANR